MAEIGTKGSGAASLLSLPFLWVYLLLVILSHSQALTVGVPPGIQVALWVSHSIPSCLKGFIAD